jgi:chromosome segregation ATPase
VLELDAYKSGRRSTSNIARGNSANSSAANKTSLTTKLDAHIKNIENERDFFKQEVDTLQKLLKAIQAQVAILPTVTPSTSTTTTIIECNSSNSNNNNNNKNRRSPASHSSRRETDNRKSPANSQTRCSVCASRINNRSKSPRSTGGPAVRSSVSVSNIHEAAKAAAGLEHELKQVRRERDELKCLLDKFERHMADVQQNVACVTNERDKFEAAYENARAELMKVTSKSSNVSLATQALLKRVESERDAAVCETRATAGERDALRERLRHVTDAAVQDKACLEQRVDEEASRAHSFELDKRDLCQQVDLLREQLEHAERRSQQLGHEV